MLRPVMHQKDTHEAAETVFVRMYAFTNTITVQDWDNIRKTDGRLAPKRTADYMQRVPLRHLEPHERSVLPHNFPPFNPAERYKPPTSCLLQ